MILAYWVSNNWPRAVIEHDSGVACCDWEIHAADSLFWRCKMRQQNPKVKYTIIDPNTPHEVQKLLKMMIVEKLLTVKA